MKYLTILFAVFSMMVLSNVTFAQSGGSNNPVSDASYASIDQKVAAQMNVLKTNLELNNEQYSAVESILLKNELEKEIAMSSEQDNISRISASLNTESTKNNELKQVLTVGQYKLYKLNKLGAE